VSPTVYKEGAFRFYFFSREEKRIHVHVTGPDGEAKFWLEPIVALATAHGLSKKQLTKLQESVEAHYGEIVNAWKAHFGG
jgi:hypothetical protein